MSVDFVCCLLFWTLRSNPTKSLHVDNFLSIITLSKPITLLRHSLNFKFDSHSFPILPSKQQVILSIESLFILNRWTALSKTVLPPISPNPRCHLSSASPSLMSNPFVIQSLPHYPRRVRLHRQALPTCKDCPLSAGKADTTDAWSSSHREAFLG